MAKKGNEAKAVSIERRAPTATEAAAFTSARIVHDNMPVRPSYNIEHGDAFKFDAKHSDEQGEACLLAQSLGSRSDEFQNTAVAWVLRAAQNRNGSINGIEANAGLAAVAAFEPQNETETMLAVQAFSTHNLSMDMMVRAKTASSLEETQQYVSMATKLSRTFTAQMEAFGKLKRGGEQVVRHIHVDNRGGQAVIAETVNTGGRNNEIFDEQTHAKSACGPALLGQNAEGNGVPISGHGERQVSHARRKGNGRAEGE